MSDKTAQDAPQDAPAPTLNAPALGPLTEPAINRAKANEPTCAVTIDLAFTADKKRVVPITHATADSIYALAGSRIPQSEAIQYGLLPKELAS